MKKYRQRTVLESRYCARDTVCTVVEVETEGGEGKKNREIWKIAMADLEDR